jgi:hypothetical protein
MEIDVTCTAMLDERWVIEVSEKTAREIEADPTYAAALLGNEGLAKYVSQEDLRVYDEGDRTVTEVRRA